MRIGHRQVGPGHEPYIIAELGVNHDGQLSRAMTLTDLAADAGADAIKLQFFQTDLLMSRAAGLAAYQKAAGETDPMAMLARLELKPAELEAVVERAHRRRLHAIVTVFSVELVESARGIAWDAFKIASPDIVHRPLLEALCRDDRPMIVSTGASTMDEVLQAVQWLSPARRRVALLQCVSSYPAPEAALEGIGAIACATQLPTGYSDHTDSVETGAQAVEAGACLLERHLTDDRRRPGPDHAASLDPAGFAEYVHLVRRAHRPAQPPAHPPGVKRVLACEQDVRTVSRQSIVARRDLAAGETVAAEDLTFKRPGTGLEPFRLGELVGRRLARSIRADTVLTANDLA